MDEQQIVELLRSTYRKKLRLATTYGEEPVVENLGVYDEEREVMFEIVWTSQPEKIAGKEEHVFVLRWADIMTAEVVD